MKNSLVCCYMTHDHPDIMETVLKNSLNSYAEHDIDVCVYDDSEDHRTDEIVRGYINNGAHNLYYVDAGKARGGNGKLYLIMNGYGLPKDYDYIWPTKDRVYFDGTYLDRLCEKIDEDHDVVLGINEWQRWDVSHPVSCDEYNDPVLFFRDYGFFITNWECTIRRRSTMLEPVDWQKYCNLYDIENNPFNQLLSLFVRAAEMKGFSAAICRYDQNERSFAISGDSGWRAVVFDLWIDKWIDNIYKLPSIYDAYKLKVIKDETNLKDIFGSVSYMLNYSEKGILDRRIYEKYGNIWPLITDVPQRIIELVADKRYEEVIADTLKDFEDSMGNKDYLKARYIFAGNPWLKDMYDRKTYDRLFACFNEYTYDMLSAGRSDVFIDFEKVLESDAEQ